MTTPSQRQALPLTSLVATLALASSLLLIVGGFYLWAWAAGSRTTQTLQPFTKSSRILLGARVEVRGGYVLGLRVNDQGRALVSSPVLISADRYPVARYRIDKSSRLEARLFWRRADDPSRAFDVVLPQDGYAVVLGENPEWTGAINEIGLAISPIAGPASSLSEAARGVKASISLTGLTPWSRLLRLVTDWIAFRDWIGRSINHLGDSLLPAVFAGWIALAALLALCLGRIFNRRATALTVGVGVAVAWLLLATLWVSQLWRQSMQTHAQYTAATPRDRIMQGEDYALAAFSFELAQLLRQADTRGRIFFIEVERYFGERAKYLLLPHDVVHLRSVRQLRSALPYVKPGDAIVVKRDDSELAKKVLREGRINLHKLMGNQWRIAFMAAQ